MRHVFIDRFEDNGWVALEREDRQTFNVPRDWLPEDAKEGDILKVDIASQGQASRISFTVDEEEKERRLEELRASREDRPVVPEGDLEL